MTHGCFLAQFRPDVPCSGRLIRAHLLPRQLLRRELDRTTYLAAVEDPRSWIPACGGIMGPTGHHGMLDYSRTLRIPYDKLPPGTVELARELGLDWWLEREFR